MAMMVLEQTFCGNVYTDTNTRALQDSLIHKSSVVCNNVRFEMPDKATKNFK